LASSINEIDVRLRERREAYEQKRNYLNSIVLRIEQLKAELKEIEDTISELEKLPPSSKVFKTVGTIIIETTVENVLFDLKKRVDELNIWIQRLSRERSKVSKELLKISSELSRLSGQHGG